MSIGEKFATRNEVEQLRRKLQRVLGSITIIQRGPDVELINQFTDLIDVPSSYAAAGNFAVRVNSTEDQLEFAELKGTTNQVYITPHAADYVFSLPQDIHTAATPTFAGMYLTSASAAPFLKFTNESDTERDPIIQFAVGATPVTKFTMGVDDSDADKWKLANAISLGTGPTGDLFFGDVLYYTHETHDSIVGVELEDFTTDDIYIIGGTGTDDGKFDNIRQLAYDGTYLYAADSGNDRVQKFLAAGGTFVLHTTTNLKTPWGVVYWNGYIYVSCINAPYNGEIAKFDATTMTFQSSFGSFGTGDNQFKNPRSMTTDGIWLYICDYGNQRVKKHTLAGAYVCQVGSAGTGDGEFNHPCGIATDGTLVYVCDYSNYRVQIFNCSDLSFVAKVNMPDRTGSGAGNPASITLNGTYWYVGVNDSAPFRGYHIKYDIATNTFQAYYDCSAGSGDYPNAVWGSIIFKEYVDKTAHGDLIVVHVDGSFLDIYPKTRFFDSIRLYESADPVVEYVGIEAPVDVTLSYNLILPPTVNTVKAHLYADVGGVLGWGQNVDTDGSPELAGLTLTGFSGILWASGGIVADGAVLADLSDVYFPSGEPDIGDVLTYESGGWTSMPGGAGIENFVDLLDVPANYAGAGGFVVKVNAGATGLEFVAGGAGVSSFNDLDDVPASYVGQEGLFVRVNGTADGLEYAASGGAPTAAKYIVSAAHVDLSAEIVKAYMGDNEDLDSYPSSPNAMDDEFENGAIDGKWTLVNNPAGANAFSETAHAGSLFVGLIEQANPEYEANLIVAYQAAPGGDGSAAMTWIAKVAVANPGDATAGFGQYAGAGIIIWNPTNHEYVISTAELRAASSCMFRAIGYHQGAAANYALTASTTSYPIDFPQASWIYLKLEKSTTAVWTSANTYNMYMSLNGILWSMVGTESKTFTTAPSRIGLYWRAVIAAAGAAKAEAVVDFFRRTV